MTDESEFNKDLEEVTNGILASKISQPAESYLNWHDYFMATAFLIAKRSKDPCTKVGACIVDPDNRIVGTGYNGMPKGCDDSKFPWGKTGPPIENKHMYVCHAEMNAVLNSSSHTLKNCRMYVGLFPCNECAKIIIQAGIKEVIYLSDKNFHKVETEASRRMFNSSGVEYWKYVPRQQRIVLDFVQDLRLNEEPSGSDLPDSTSKYV